MNSKILHFFEQVGSCYFSYKGILKYGNSRLRSLSESCAGNYRYLFLVFDMNDYLIAHHCF